MDCPRYAAECQAGCQKGYQMCVQACGNDTVKH